MLTIHLSFKSSYFHRFDFSKKEGLIKNEYIEKKVTALCDGNVDAFVMWWDLDMDIDGEIQISCAPKWCRPPEIDLPVSSSSLICCTIICF